jgi:hypothetical protein
MFERRCRTGIPLRRLSSACMLCMLCSLLTLAACGGGGNAANSVPPPPTIESVSAADTARLLEQATFGVTTSDVSNVQNVGIDAYIDQQLAYSPTQYTGYSYTPHTAPAGVR